MKWLALAFLAALAGCNTVQPAITACPVLVPYSAAQQAQAADELDKLPAGAMLRTFMKDYGGLRAGVRACSGVQSSQATVGSRLSSPLA